MAKVAVFMANGVEECEALIVVDLLRRAGEEVCMVSINETPEVEGSHAIKIGTDAVIAGLDFDAFDMLILPGGMPGTKHLEACEPLTKAVLAFDAKKKPIGAICAAPGVFGRLGILKGRKACSYPGCLDASMGCEISEDKVVVSDHITTSRGMGTAIDFGLAIIARFEGQAASDAMAEKIVY
ncbi:MAG: DJ-1/PfpI family protein [Lachnospiraceae bacterium]|nr:DJ-1/PfpI family protein [Lachnospiraceae bacterium]